MSAILILVCIALLLGILSLIPATSQWPVLAVAVILLSVAMLIGRG